MQRTILTLTMTCLTIGLAQPQSDRDLILKAEEQFRVAKLKNDTATLGSIVAEDYYGVNQYGAKRDKKQLLELFSNFPIQSLTTDSVDVRITGDTAVVTGTQTEVNGMGTEHMVYMRVYVRSAGAWKLLANMQFINPSS